MSNLCFTMHQEKFEKVPGNPIVYWMSNGLIDSFQNESLSKYFISRIGLVTGSVDRFLRFWFEPNIKRIALNKDKSCKWFPYQKGGSYRKWYGNNDYVVNWENNGFEMINQNFADNGRVKSHNYNGEYAFKNGITWTKITTGEFSSRIVNDIFMFDDAGCMGFAKLTQLEIIAALLNSKLGKVYIEFFKGEDMNCLPGHLDRIPFNKEIVNNKNVIMIVDNNVSISKQDWDSFETSWEFKKHPLI